jgi:endogenous inhibitor of DNA gyrase (YacG/DUF329 family)
VLVLKEDARLAMAKARKVKCPTCGAPVVFDASSRFRPFCSDRCRTTDLGAWAAGQHRIPGDPIDALSEADPVTDGARPERGPGDPLNDPE